MDTREILVGRLLEVQREMLELNKAKTLIRAILPPAYPLCVALEAEIMVRFEEIRKLRVALGNLQTEEVKHVGQ